MMTLEKLRRDLAASEEEWLTLEARREALALGAEAVRP
jgi:hypothetical protein